MDVNWKMILKSLGFGALIFAIGNFLLKYIDQYVTFISQDLFKHFLGLTPPNVIAFSIAVYLAEKIREKVPALK